MTNTSPGRGAARVWGRVEWLRSRLGWRPRADSGTVRGTLWTLLLAVDFYLMSNPIVFLGDFDHALRRALVVTSVFVLVNLFWIRLPGIPWDVLLFLGLAALSVRWSINAPTTWQAVELYALVAAIALLIAANVTVPVLVDGLALGGVLVLAASLYARHAQLPGAGPTPEFPDSYMAGIGTHKNILAYTLVLALTAAVSVVPRTRLGWVARVAAGGFILVGIYLAYSGTGFIAAAAAVATSVFLIGFEHVGRRWARRKRLLVEGAVVVAILATLALGKEFVFGWLGKDDSLTGRVPVWNGIIAVAEHGPLWLGSGWGAVWGHPWQLAPENIWAYRIYAVGGLVTHGHNSFLDLLPQIGLVGIGLCLLVYLRTTARAVSWRHRPDGGRTMADASRFLLVGIVGHLVLGLTEPLFTIPVGWFVLVLMVAVRVGRPEPPPTRVRGKHVRERVPVSV